MPKTKKPLPLKALKDNILMLPLAKDEKSPGGIIVTASKQKDPYRKGVVLAIGPGLDTEVDVGNSKIPEDIKEGSILLFHSTAGWDVEFEGTKYVMVSWRQVEGMVNPDYVDWMKENEN
jgi:chaperonin GroES